jgi:putative ABC transport system permease protein
MEGCTSLGIREIMRKKNSSPPLPPRLARWVLSWIINNDIRYSAQGDFDEIFALMAKEEGIHKARLWYWIQLVKSIPSFVRDILYWRSQMFKNYLKIAFRNIARQKLYSFISIGGLAVGMAFCFVILIFLIDEMNYDSFHQDSGLLYRVVRKMPDMHGPSTRNPLAPAIKENFPEVDLAVRTYLLPEPNTLIIEKVTFQQEGILFAGSDFFRMFTYQFIRGDSENPLEDPFSIVLTQTEAKKYFGAENPVGQTISFDGEFDLQVTAVIEDVPHNSHLQFEVVLPMKGFNEIHAYIYGYKASYRLADRWTTGMFHTYVKLNENSKPEALEQKFPEFLKKYAPYNQELLDESLYLQPVEKIHLYSPYRSQTDKIRDIKFIYAVIAVGLVILLMACFNAVNLTTARFSARIKEIGIRKVVGAQKTQLTVQFLMEAAVFSLCAFFLSLVFIILLGPIIKDILGYPLTFSYLKEYSVIVFGFFIGLFTVVVSGSYPAVFFSSFLPKNILKEMTKKKTTGKGVRSVFVLIQYSITIALLASTGLIYKQVQYMKSKDLGYSKEQIVVVPVKDDTVRERYETVKNELNRIPDISRVSFSSALPSHILRSTTMDLEIDGERKVFEMNYLTIDYDFLDLYDVDIINGRNYSKEYPSDIENAVVINLKAAQMLNWENPIGKNLEIFGREREVIGVVEDFNFQTLHTEIGPLAMRISGGGSYKFASMKISTNNIQKILGRIESTFNNFSPPKRPFEYFFFDDYFANLYRTEENFGKTMGCFTLLAVILSSLGLFGLAYFSTEQRTKEIGIRKVMGASIPRIISMLSAEFIKWALIANLIAVPAAYLVMSQWLQNFAYKINIGWSVFVLSGALAIVLSLLTVSTQTIRAALKNPADTLRYE